MVAIYNQGDIELQEKDDQSLIAATDRTPNQIPVLGREKNFRLAPHFEVLLESESHFFALVKILVPYRQETQRIHVIANWIGVAIKVMASSRDFVARKYWPGQFVSVSGRGKSGASIATSEFASMPGEEGANAAVTEAGGAVCDATMLYNPICKAQGSICDASEDRLLLL